MKSFEGTVAATLGLILILAVFVLGGMIMWEAWQPRIIVEAVDVPAEITAKNISSAELTNLLKTDLDNLLKLANEGWNTGGVPLANAAGGGSFGVQQFEERSEISIGGTSYQGLVDFLASRFGRSVIRIEAAVSDGAHCRDAAPLPGTPNPANQSAKTGSPIPETSKPISISYTVTHSGQGATAGRLTNSTDFTECQELADIHRLIWKASYEIWSQIDPRVSAVALSYMFNSPTRTPAAPDVAQALFETGKADIAVFGALLSGFAAHYVHYDEGATLYFGQALELQSDSLEARLGRAVAEDAVARRALGAEPLKQKIGEGRATADDLKVAKAWFDAAMADFASAIASRSAATQKPAAGSDCAAKSQINKEIVPAYLMRGLALLLDRPLSDVGKAVSDFAAAACADSSSVLAWVGWGAALLEQEHYDEALPKLQKAAILAPSEGALHRLIAVALVGQAQQGQAKGDLKVAADRYAQAAARFELAALWYQQARDTARAQDALESAKGAEKKSSDVLNAGAAKQAAAVARQRLAANELRQGNIAQSCAQLRVAAALYGETGQTLSAGRLTAWGDQLGCNALNPSAALTASDRARLADSVDAAAAEVHLPTFKNTLLERDWFSD
jgi:tetratricopeptide (TPR) repeat protein